MFQKIIAAISVVVIALVLISTAGSNPQNIMQQIYVVVSVMAWVVGVYVVTRLIGIITR